MRNFTFSDAKSHKFWNIELKGKSFTVTYGRIGTAGQTQTKEFATEEKARAEHDKLIKEKTSKGYVEQKPTGSPATPGVALPSGSLREALEAAIVADPDDLMAHQAHADHLNEIGDPKGEFIQVQLALEDPDKPAAERKKLQKKETDLLKKHGRAWLGDLAPFLLDQQGLEEYQIKAGGYTHAFRRGWLDTITATSFNLAFTRVLATAPEARALRQLVLEENQYEYDFEPAPDIPEEAESPVLYPLARARNLANVRIFRLGEVADEKYPRCHTNGEAAVGVVKQMQKLEELYLLAHQVDTEQLFGLKTLNTLRILQVYHCNNYPLAKLGKNPSLSNLTHLLCFPHALEPDDEEPYLRLPDLRGLVRSPHLKSLTHLQLRLSNFGDRGIDEIMSSGILKRLKLLDLHGGTVTDKGAGALAKCVDLKNLESLVLSRNCLTKEGISALQATGVKLTAEAMWQPGHTEGEFGEFPEYLYEGDYE